AGALRIGACAVDLGGFGGALRLRSFYTVNGMDGLAQPGLRLDGCVPGLFVSQDGFVKRGLCLSQGSLGFIVVSLRDAYRGVGLIDLVYRDVLLLQQWLDAVQVVGRVLQPRLGTGLGCLSAGDSGFGEVDAAAGGLNSGLRDMDCSTGCLDGAVLSGDLAPLVDDLLLEQLLIG